MKKIVLSITSILIGVAIAITIVFVFSERKREVYINSSYNDVRLSFGKTKVKEINKVRSSSLEIERMNYISDPYEFYENKIKTSEYYNSKLVFEDEYDNIFGYLIKDEVAFKYKVSGDFIMLSTMGVESNIEGRYDIVLADFYDFMGINQDIYVGYAEDCSWVFYYNHDIKYHDVVELYKHMNGDMVKIDDDIIYLKGYDIDLNLSEDYVVKIVNKNGKAYGCVYDYPTA